MAKRPKSRATNSKPHKKVKVKSAPKRNDRPRKATARKSSVPPAKEPTEDTIRAVAEGSLQATEAFNPASAAPAFLVEAFVAQTLLAASGSKLDDEPLRRKIRDTMSSSSEFAITEDGRVFFDIRAVAPPLIADGRLSMGVAASPAAGTLPTQDEIVEFIRRHVPGGACRDTDELLGQLTSTRPNTSMALGDQLRIRGMLIKAAVEHFRWNPPLICR